MLIVITGIALVGAQVMEAIARIRRTIASSYGAEAGSTKFQVETTFPGVLVIALGMLLLIAGRSCRARACA